MKNSKKKKIKSIMIFIICFILLITIIFSGYKIVIWHLDNKRIEELEKYINESVVIEDVLDNEETILIQPKEEIKKEDPYRDYIKINLIDVDFSELKEKNNDTKGWLYVGGTNVNYPFVQHNNNKFYLNHSFDKKYNAAGWVFADYRNKLDGTDKNIIIYAHGRLNNAMFGSLKKIIKKKWYNNPDNHIVKISTENENTLWQVFSVYKIKSTNDYIQTEFFSDEEYLKFLQMLKNRSKFNFNTTVNEKMFRKNIYGMLTATAPFEKSRIDAERFFKDLKYKTALELRKNYNTEKAVKLSTFYDEICTLEKTLATNINLSLLFCTLSSRAYKI